MATAYGVRLKIARINARMTQIQLAKITGIPQSTISTAEREGHGSRETPVYAQALGVSAFWLATGKDSPEDPEPVLPPCLTPTPSNQVAASVDIARAATQLIANADYAGAPRLAKPTPVVGTAKMGDNGYYEAFDYPVGQGDGWVDSYSPDPNAYALRVKGDSMHPAIRHGNFVVVEPNGRCVPGEFVAIVLKDGRKMVKELVIEREHEIVIESVNGNHRQTLERSDIEKMHPIASVVAASKWRQG